MHKILDLVSNPEIKWTKSRSRLEARDWRKQNLDLVSKVKLGISSMSDTICHMRDLSLTTFNVAFYLKIYDSQVSDSEELTNNLNGGHVPLKPDDLPHQLMIAHPNDQCEHPKENKY